MKKVFLVALMAMMSTAVLADYITPEGNVEIATGIYARASAAKEIKDLGITEYVIKLYNKDISVRRSNISTIEDANGCIELLVNTEGGKKNFIEQIIYNKKECSK